MTPIVVIAAIAGYFALLFLISWAVNRNNDGSTAFTSKVPWWVSAIATMGAAISGVTFISVPGMVIGKEWSYLQMCLGFIVGYFVIAYVLIPLFYKRNLISIYGYLDSRYGTSSYKTGAWFFFISKMLGAAVRFYVVCIVLQTLVFGPLGIPFVFNVIVTIALIFLYTLQGGVKTVIWTDTLKSLCLILSVVLSIVFIAKGLGLGFGDFIEKVSKDGHTRLFYFDDPKSGLYFWKQFVSGVFMVIAMTGLDQDMTQRSLACKDPKSAQKSLISATFSQTVVIFLFLVLGSILMIYYSTVIGSEFPSNTDDLFGLVATHSSIPVIVGILFIVGLVSAAYSAAGSALTALTTSFTIDILETNKKNDDTLLEKTRKNVHLLMAAIMGVVIVVFYFLNSQDAISAVYTIASYTYGPILGLFAFGMFCQKQVRDKFVPIVCIAAPIISLVTKIWLDKAFQYTMGFELLLFNATVTIIGLCLLIKSDK
ncbi:MAG: sodium:solute symporter [Bacteroidales bacterium]|nr:sodium:solute symporter [Bacteroidales bacterium]